MLPKVRLDLCNHRARKGGFASRTIGKGIAVGFVARPQLKASEATSSAGRMMEQSCHHQLQPCANGSLCIVLMCLRIAEVHEDTVTHVFGDETAYGRPVQALWLFSAAQNGGRYLRPHRPQGPRCTERRISTMMKMPTRMAKKPGVSGR